MKKWVCTRERMHLRNVHSAVFRLPSLKSRHPREWHGHASMRLAWLRVPLKIS